MHPEFRWSSTGLVRGVASPRIARFAEESLLCARILDWAFVFEVWLQGIERLRELLAHDLEHGVALAARQGAAAGTITAPANALYSIVFCQRPASTT